jgi:hypothetical protein
MNGFHKGQSQDGNSVRSEDRRKRYFVVNEDYIILMVFQEKSGLMSINEILKDICLRIDRDPSAVKERYKKLSKLSEEDKARISGFVEQVRESH